MAAVYYDRIRDTSTTAGTGTIAVSGTPPTNYNAFSARYTVGQPVPYLIISQVAAEWEVGEGTYSGTNQISRTTGGVADGSSGPGVLVNFSAGTKDVVVVLTATSDTYAIPQWNVSLLGSGCTLSNGNRTVTQGSAIAGTTLSVASHSAGKWYAECTVGVWDSGATSAFGVATVNEPTNGSIGFDVRSWAYYENYGFLFFNGANGPAVTTSTTSGDTFMVAYDGDTGNLWFGLNGVWQNSGNPAAGTNPAFAAIFTRLFLAATTAAVGISFILNNFKYAIPAGFSAWGNSASVSGGSVPREILQAGRTYYVRSDGNDNNTGLGNSAGNAFLTLQKGWNAVAALDLNGFNVTIQCGTVTTWTTGINITATPIGGATVVLDLNGGTISTATDCIVNNTNLLTIFQFQNG